MIHVEHGEIWFKKDCPKLELQKDVYCVIKILKDNDYLTDDEIMIAVASGLAGKFYQSAP